MHFHHCFLLKPTGYFELWNSCSRMWHLLLRATHIWIRRCRTYVIGHSLGIWWDGWNIKRFDVFFEGTTYTALVLDVLLSGCKLIRTGGISMIHRTNTRIRVVLELKRSLLVVSPLSMWYNTSWWCQIFILRYVILGHTASWCFQLAYYWRLFV